LNFVRNPSTPANQRKEATQMTKLLNQMHKIQTINRKEKQHETENHQLHQSRVPGTLAGAK
jgi:hypothetical protein